MREQINIENIRGTTVYGADGEKIGKVGEVYLDDQTNQPEWATVNTGLFGGDESFVPLSDASITSDRLSLPYDKETVKDAPSIANDGHLTPDQERQLYAHYGLSYDGYSNGRGTGDDDSTRDDTSGRDTDDAMTRSEERVDVGTRTEVAGRARLRKYVVTENETHTVPVRKERADQATLTEEVRKERVEAEGDIAHDSDR